MPRTSGNVGVAIVFIVSNLSNPDLLYPFYENVYATGPFPNTNISTVVPNTPGLLDSENRILGVHHA